MMSMHQLKDFLIKQRYAYQRLNKNSITMHINVYSQPSKPHKFADLPVQPVAHGQLASRHSVDLNIMQ